MRQIDVYVETVRNHNHIMFVQINMGPRLWYSIATDKTQTLFIYIASQSLFCQTVSSHTLVLVYLNTLWYCYCSHNRTRYVTVCIYHNDRVCLHVVNS